MASPRWEGGEDSSQGFGGSDMEVASDFLALARMASRLIRRARGPEALAAQLRAHPSATSSESRRELQRLALCLQTCISSSSTQEVVTVATAAGIIGASDINGVGSSVELVSSSPLAIHSVDESNLMRADTAASSRKRSSSADIAVLDSKLPATVSAAAASGDVVSAFALAGAAPTPVRVASSSSSSKVLPIDDLPDACLVHIMGLLVGDTREAVRRLGELALVSKRWRALASSDDLWKPICRRIWPVLHDEAVATSHRGGSGISRGSSSTRHQLPQLASSSCAAGGGSLPPAVVGVASRFRNACRRRGLMLISPRIMFLSSTWNLKYRINFQIVDQRDGHCLLAGEGPLEYQAFAVNGDIRTRIQIGAEGARIRAEPLTAASRECGTRRFADLREYFTTCHQRTSLADLRVRVIARNIETGHEAMVYRSDQGTPREVQDPSAMMALPNGSIAVLDSQAYICPKPMGFTHLPLVSYFVIICVPHMTPSSQTVEAWDALPKRDRSYVVHTGAVGAPLSDFLCRGLNHIVFCAPPTHVASMFDALDFFPVE